MVKLKVIAFFFSLLMLLQMVPIAQIGQMLSTNQWTEELPHNSNDQCGKAEASFHPNFFSPEINYNIAIAEGGKALAYLHSSDQIPSNHSTDVVSPPPDAVA